MIDARFRPWPDPPRCRYATCSYKATYGRTLDDLEREIRYLNGKSIIIEAGFELNQIRNDGWPLGKATPKHPAVAVSFDSKHGPLRIVCVNFGKWEYNLRAIAQHLEYLRLAGLYGVGKGDEQYRGWKQIAAPARQMTVEDAALFIVKISGPVPGGSDGVIADHENFREAYRMAAARTHPDSGGDRAAWDKVQDAKTVLDAHHAARKATA